MPISLRVFLTALAIIDDLGGILTIALFYTETINLIYLGMAAVMLLALSMMNIFKVRGYWLYFLLAIPLWYFVFNSGIHATIAGVVLALTIPIHKIERLEHRLHDPVNFIVLPLFALANTAILLPLDMGFIFSSPVHHGIVAGLVLGKPVGIFLFGLIAVQLKLADRPASMSWGQLWGLGLIAGIGFTMSIFITMLAFDLPGIQLIGKVAIIEASLLAGVAGFIYLRFTGGRKVANRKAAV